MKRETYYHGLPGVKWGIWNTAARCFQFGISEDTPMLAQARLHQKIGDDARKYRFEPRQLPKEERSPCISCQAHYKAGESDLRKPLTLDEMQALNGEPVWTETIGVSDSGRWELCTCETICTCPLQKVLRCVTATGIVDDYNLDTYGETWLAYRFKPVDMDERRRIVAQFVDMLLPSSNSVTGPKNPFAD